MNERKKAKRSKGFCQNKNTSVTAASVLNITYFLDTSAAMCKQQETSDFDTGKTAAENKQSQINTRK